MGCCYNPFLGCCPLGDFPPHDWCPRTCRRFWLLRRIERLCFDYDFLPCAWYVRPSIRFSFGGFLTIFPSPFQKETKQRTLEELDYVFAVPTSKHISYQAKVFLPYWIRRYVFFQKVELQPLYNFDEVESITVFEKGVGH